MRRQIQLVEAPSALGLKQPAPGTLPGVRFFPETLQATGFAENLGIGSAKRVEPPAYHPEVDPATGIRNIERIGLYSQQLADTLLALPRDAFQLVIGGDCSIVIGCALALKKQGNFALFSLDGHTDYMLPQHSATAGAAGMALALVTGNGPETLSDIQGLSPYVQEQHVFAVGNREFTDWYVQLIVGSAVQYTDLPTSRSKGWSRLAENFLDMVHEKKLDGFWIHFDVDALHHDIMPCVDSPEPDGLQYAEWRALMLPLLQHPRCKGMNITIYDATLDPGRQYIEAFSRELQAVLRQALG